MADEQRQVGVGARLQVRPDRGQRAVVEEDDALLVALAGDQPLARAALLHVGPVEARELLPEQCGRATWIQQMANTVALAHAFAIGDGELLRRALDDRYAEPPRATLIPNFYDMKRAALDAGAFGCSISGSGPTLFAVAADEPAARQCAAAMERAFGEVASTHVGAIAKEGVRRA